MGAVLYYNLKKIIDPQDGKNCIFALTESGEQVKAPQSKFSICAV